jgi:methylated-DNA-[protein]-cysteine S-methyltransferase
MTVPTSLDERFRAAAAAEGLLDAGYDVVDSPVGPLFVAATPRGVCRISYDADVDRQEARLADAYGLRVLRAPRAVDEAKRELDDYFEGRRTSFELALDLEHVAPFHREVLAELARVPFGRTTTYGTLAAQAGRPSAARAVGTVMNRNPIPIVLPCHRVVGANGSLTGYAGGLHVKEALLRLEGAIL